MNGFSWFNKARMSFLVRLWVLACVFVVPFWIFELAIGKLALWMLFGAGLGLGWAWRHKQEPDPPAASEPPISAAPPSSPPPG
jgi:energy-coupling factor transporter transmembrane protein EcfT